ncbi:MAG: hypothetical protein AAGH48_04110, partial [Pseudomonadota bacterium]
MPVFGGENVRRRGGLDTVTGADAILARDGLRLADITVSPSVITEDTTDVTVEITATVDDNQWAFARFT